MIDQRIAGIMPLRRTPIKRFKNSGPLALRIRVVGPDSGVDPETVRPWWGLRLLLIDSPDTQRWQQHDILAYRNGAWSGDGGIGSYTTIGPPMNRLRAMHVEFPDAFAAHEEVHVIIGAPILKYVVALTGTEAQEIHPEYQGTYDVLFQPQESYSKGYHTDPDGTLGTWKTFASQQLVPYLDITSGFGILNPAAGQGIGARFDVHFAGPGGIVIDGGVYDTAVPHALQGLDITVDYSTPTKSKAGGKRAHFKG